MSILSQKTYDLRVPGETQSLALVRLVVTSLAKKAGLAEDDVGRVEIAVDEACTNVLEHAYRTISPTPPVDLCIHSTENQLIVDILDQGASFDFDGYVPPTFPDHWHAGHTRGVGLYLIKQCMDEVLYERLPDDRNRMRLIKRINQAAEALA